MHPCAGDLGEVQDYVGGRELFQKNSGCLRESPLQPRFGAGPVLITNGLSEFLAWPPLVGVYVSLVEAHFR